MYLFWLMLTIFLIFIEMITINLTTIWFIVSSLVVLFLSFFIDSFTIQVALFIILGLILLVKSRPILVKYLNKNKEKTNIDRIIGMRGVVIDDILLKSYGSVKVDGKIWTAYSDKELKKDTFVKILKINGNKLEVEEEN